MRQSPTLRAHTARRSDRLGSRTRPHRRRARRPEAPHAAADRKAGRGQEQTTDVATVEQPRRTFEAAAKTAAKLHDGIRDRAVAPGRRPQPAPATAPPPHAQQPRTQNAPGRTTAGAA